MKVRRLEHYNIRTTKFDETVKFYDDVLGMKAQQPPMMQGDWPPSWIYDDSGIAAIHLTPVDPKDPEAAYTIGVIDWSKAHQNKLAALQSAGLNDDGSGNVKAPKKVMEPLAAQNAPLIDEGLKYLTMAVDNRPNYDDAMQYLNLIYRNKADVDYGNSGAVSQDMAMAQNWSTKAMDTRKANGGVFLGLNGIVIKSHGGADAEGFAAATHAAWRATIREASQSLGLRVWLIIQSMSMGLE